MKGMYALNYLFLSRTIYALPFLFYCMANFYTLLKIPQAYPFFGLWGITFLLSIFFFSISKKVLPLMLIHFIFLLETYLFVMLVSSTGDATFFLFIILSSFYTIESLRNNSLNLLGHIFCLFGGLYYLYAYMGVSFNDFELNFSTLLIIASPILCRAIMSASEERDVLLQEVVKEKSVYVPMENTEKMKKLNEDISVLTKENRNIQDKYTDMQKEKKALENKYQENEGVHEANQNVAKTYFSLLANIRFDLSRTLLENVNNTLQVFLSLTNAQYVALILLETGTEEEEEEEVSLIGSCKAKELPFTDAQILETESVSEYILSTLESNHSEFQDSEKNIQGLAPLKSIIYTPIAQGSDIKGVLIQAFDMSYSNNIHNFNLSLMVAYHIYTILQNENLYKQAKDASFIDGLTGCYNKKYLLNNMQSIFNNTYNYGTNLACLFIDADYFKQVNDQHGHKVGDKVLSKLATILRSHIRQSDFVIRFGGDEFIVLLNSVSIEKLEEFCKTVNEELLSLYVFIVKDGQRIPFSVTMGAKIYYPLRNNISSGEELLQAADKALYQAKSKQKGTIHIED